jgi:hypothetical protein
LISTTGGYVLAIAVHREDKILRELDSVIKVGRRRVADLRHAEEVVTSYLSRLGPVTPGVEFARGKAFGIRAFVEAWLCGPIASRDAWGPPTAAAATSAGPAERDER